MRSEILSRHAIDSCRSSVTPHSLVCRFHVLTFENCFHKEGIALVGCLLPCRDRLILATFGMFRALPYCSQIGSCLLIHCSCICSVHRSSGPFRVFVFWPSAPRGLLCLLLTSGLPRSDGVRSPRVMRT